MDNNISIDTFPTDLIYLISSFIHADNFIPLKFVSKKINSYVIDKKAICDQYDFAIDIIMDGHFNLLKWIFTELNYPLKKIYAGYFERDESDVCAYAALNGHFDILKWGRENGFEWNDSTCANAAQNGHFDILNGLEKMDVNGIMGHVHTQL